MSTIFTLLFILSLIAFVVGMIKPGLVMRLAPEEKRNRKWVAIVTLVGAIVFFFLAGITVTPEEKAAHQAKIEQQQQEKALKQQAAAEKKAAEDKAAAEMKAAENKKAEEERAAKEKAAAEVAALNRKRLDDYNALYEQILSTVQPADDAMQARKDAASSGDVVGTVYRMKDERDAIELVKVDLSNISAPESFSLEDKKNFEEGKKLLIQSLDQRDTFIMYSARYIQNQTKENMELAQQFSKQSEASMMSAMGRIVGIGLKYEELNK